MSSVLDRPELSSSGKKYDLIFAIYDYHRKDNEQWFSYTQHTDENPDIGVISHQTFVTNCFT